MKIGTNIQHPYPRLCAHRGFNAVAPENSLPAFGAAMALGAEEIEFDLWWTSDGEIVSCHDARLERVSTGTGKVYEHTYEELRQLDFGVKYGEKFAGLTILKFEEILERFACQIIMNVHIKCLDDVNPCDEEYLKKIIALIRKYNCEQYVYFMSGNDELLKQAKALAPDIALCCGKGSRGWEIVDRAINIGCQKVQFFKPYFNQEMIDKAHAHGMTCNMCWSDDVEEAKEFLRMGIDTILTNDYLKVWKIR